MTSLMVALGIIPNMLMTWPSVVTFPGSPAIGCGINGVVVFAQLGIVPFGDGNVPFVGNGNGDVPFDPLGDSGKPTHGSWKLNPDISDRRFDNFRACHPHQTLSRYVW